MTADTSDEYSDRDADEGYASRRSGRGWPSLVVAIVVVVGLGLGLGLTLGRSSSGASGATVGPEGVLIQNVPDLASPDSTRSGAPVDGITCPSAMNQTDPYHVHVHLAIFVNGRQLRIPAGAGIVPPRASEQLPGGLFVDSGSKDCLYWLHVHANDGVIHVEAPTKRSFTLGEFFDVWGQPLGFDQVGPARGAVVAFSNRKRFAGNPRDISLTSQAVIQLDVGFPVVAFEPLEFKVSGLCSSSCSAISSS